MEIIKAAIGWPESVERCAGMSYVIDHLAGNPVSVPISNIRVDIGPHILEGDKSLGGSDTWMCDDMRRVEKNAPKLFPDQHMMWFCQGITNQERGRQLMWNRLQT